jgi:hypothetical protein
MAQVTDMLHDRAYLVQNLKEFVITLLLLCSHGLMIVVKNN